jgi:hypothetical protein
MAKANEELTSPAEWLRRFADEQGGYARLVNDSGGAARAAYRLARARCRVESTTNSEPTVEDLQAAHRLLAPRVGRGGALPITSVLASDADISGLYAVHSTIQGALRSLPPPPPSSQARSPSRSDARKAEARSRPSASSQS